MRKLPVQHSFSFPGSQLVASWVIGLYWFLLQIFLQLRQSNLAQQMPGWQEAAAMSSQLYLKKNKKYWVQERDKKEQQKVHFMFQANRAESF